eukprot:227717_1
MAPNILSILFITQLLDVINSQNGTTSPSSNPTPAPTDCVSDIDEIIPVHTLNGWTLQTQIDRNLTSNTFVIKDDAQNCYASNPCIRIIGIDPGTNQYEYVWIERTFDVLGYIDINIHIEISTSEFESGEYGFIETICNN